MRFLCRSRGKRASGSSFPSLTSSQTKRGGREEARVKSGWPWPALAVVLVALTCLGVTTPTARAGTIYVTTKGADANDGQTWETAKLTVAGGLAAAANGDQVWVAAGTYVGCITLKDGVALYGGFAGNESQLSARNWVTNVTVLDGNTAGSVVTAPSGATASTRIDGFTLRNGSGTVGSYGFSYGGGVYCSYSSPIISNNTITANTVSGSGGGICCLKFSLPVISNNAITENSAVLAATGYGGGGIYCDSSSPVISNNTILGNSTTSAGGGIYCNNNSFPVISDNEITGNMTNNTAGGAGGAGIYCYSSAPTISNNTIIGNIAASVGGGIRCETCSPAMCNNTIVNNIASGLGGGIYCSSSQSAISNSILAFNSSGLYNFNGSPTLRNNCVYNPAGTDYTGLSAGIGDISADPRLLAPSYGNFHLQAGSPCIDAGYDETVQAGSLDLDAEPRIQGAHVDIGADEFDGKTPTYAPAIIRVDPSGNDANDGSSWGLARLTVQTGIDAASIHGGEVWVAAGTYKQRITLRPWVYVYGGFGGTEISRGQRNWATHVTVLDGGAGGSVVTAVSTGYRMSCVDGFTISNGIGTWSSGSRYGGGIYCASSPMIANDVIRGNSADYGGGVYCFYSSPPISNSTIVGNKASTSGGGLYDGFSSLTVTNCTFGGNTAPFSAGLYNSYSTPTLANCILWGNNGPAVANNCSTPTITYSNIQGGYAGTGNINLDPRFVRNPSGGPDGIWCTPDDDYGDLRLRAGSPCIDAGNNAATVTAGIAADLDDHLRFFNDPATTDCQWSPGTCGAAPIVDIGAFEFIPLIPGDFDHDGDLDMADLAVFQACVSGPSVLYAGDCLKADLDRDNDVDQADFGIFQRCYSGAGQPADPNCVR